MMSEIDFSNEGLSERVEGVEVVEAEATTEVAEDAAESVSEGDTDVESEDASSEDPEPEAEVGEAPEEAPVGEVVVEGEQPNEWQVRYDEAQKVIGRQGQELGELRRMVEQIQQQAQPPAEPEPQQAWGSRSYESVDQLLDGAATPEQASDAFYFAAQNAPDLIPDVLAEIQAHDPGLAKRFEIELYQAMIQSTVAPVQGAYQQTQAEREAASVVTNYGATVEGWADIKDEVARIIEEEPDLVGSGTPAEIERGLKWATRMAQQARAVQQQHAQAAQQQASMQQRQAAIVETGTPAAAPIVEEKSPEDIIREQIFAEDKRRRDALNF
jgi:predicted RNA-binding protein YlqC (UPF0109 family)